MMLDREARMMHHMPFVGQSECRIYEMNKRLQQWSLEADSIWWDSFVTEFFEDDAVLTVSVCLEDGMKRYSIGRMLIPRYFRSLFEGSVSDVYFTLRHSREMFHNTTIILDCDLATMVTQHCRPLFTKVLTEGRLIVEFTLDDMMRIRFWHFAIRQFYELVPRSVLAMPQRDPLLTEQIANNITRQGLTNYTLNFLRLCVILEPMQELMLRHKMYGLEPRDCLKTTLFQKWQRIVGPHGESSLSGEDHDSVDDKKRKKANRQSAKRRKKKPSCPTSAEMMTSISISDVMMSGVPKGSPIDGQPFNPLFGVSLTGRASTVVLMDGFLSTYRTSSLYY